MAESFIELQILRQSSQAVQDTVRGPVDVAVITLGKGFEWFRHKTVDDQWKNLQIRKIQELDCVPVSV